MVSESKAVLVSIYIACSVLIIGTNLFMIGVILYSPGLRRAPRNALVVGICVADLFLGCFVMPMFTRTLVESKFPDCHTHLALQLSCDHGSFFVVGWTLVILNILHVMKMRRRRRLARLEMDSPRRSVHSNNVSTSTSATAHAASRPQTLALSTAPSGQTSRSAAANRTFKDSSRSRVPLSTIDLDMQHYTPCPSVCSSFLPGWAQICAPALLPWLVASVTVVPLVISNASVTRHYKLDDGKFMEDVMCMLRLPRPVMVAAILMSLYLPFYLSVAFVVTFIFCHSRGTNNSYHHPFHEHRHDRAGLGEDLGPEVPDAALSSAGVESENEASDANITLQPHLSNGDSENPSPSHRGQILSLSAPLVENTASGSRTVVDTLQTQEHLSGENEQNASRQCPQRGMQHVPHRPFSSSLTADFESPLSPCLPNTIYLMCYAPLLVHTWLHLSGVYTPDNAYGPILFVALSRSFLMPFAWLVFIDIRQEVSELWNSLKSCLNSLCSHDSPGLSGEISGRTTMSSASSVTFSRLEETHVV